MTEMVEPDRTIIIVSVIGLVVIWGSFFYHRFVQGGAPPRQAGEDGPGEVPQEAGDGVSPAGGDSAPAAGTAQSGRRRGKKRRR